MAFISVRDIRVYYEIHGKGPRVLFIDGTGGDLRRKPRIFDSPVVEHFEVLAHDQRGLGQTDCPDIPYTMADYAMDADALLEEIGWNKCSVLGKSFGGMVAQEFALRYPDRIERMVIACTSSGGADGDCYPLHEFGNLSPQERALNPPFEAWGFYDDFRQACERLRAEQVTHVNGRELKNNHG